MEKSAQFVPSFRDSKAQFIVSIDFGLIDGIVTVTFDIKTPVASFDVKAPEAIFSINRMQL